MEGERKGSVGGSFMVVAVAAVAALAWLGLFSDAHARRRSSITSALHATAADPGAQGEVEENVEEPPTPGTIACCLNTPDEQGCDELTPADCAAAGGRDLGAGSSCDLGPDPCGDSEGCMNEPYGQNNNLQGGLKVTASGLTPRTRFSVLVGGVRVGALKTNAAGRGRKRFRARRLTVDPRGRRIALVNAAGASVLVGGTSDPTAHCGVSCCLSTGEEQGCEDLTAADCAAAGGVDAGTGTCEPDPCPGESPSGAFIDDRGN